MAGDSDPGRAAACEGIVGTLRVTGAQSNATEPRAEVQAANGGSLDVRDMVGEECEVDAGTHQPRDGASNAMAAAVGMSPGAVGRAVVTIFPLMDGNGVAERGGGSFGCEVSFVGVAQSTRTGG